MTDEEPRRTQGVELGELSAELDDHEYPASSDEIVEEYGDYEVELENGSESVESILGPLNEEFEDADDVRQSIVGMVDSEAVGRQRYSDRGGFEQSATDDDPDVESF
jgi:hypothetical protein